MGIGAIEKMAHELRNFNKFFNYSESFFVYAEPHVQYNAVCFFGGGKRKQKRRVLVSEASESTSHIA